MSDKQEQHIATTLDGEVQVASGGTRFGGGDVHTKHMFIEAKTVTAPRKSYSIKDNELKKCEEQCFEQGKHHWALAFRMDPDGPDYYVIDEACMMMLNDYMNDDPYM